MSEVREKIAQHIYESGASEEYFHALRTQDRPILDPERLLADAIIAALPGLVKPLEWEDHPKADGPVLSQAFVQGGGYFICDDTDDFTGAYLSFVSCDNVKWWQHVRSTSVELEGRFYSEDILPLKAAAQAHHVAQIMSAFNIGATSDHPAHPG
ncbi:MAG: hypothetical protein CL484_03125 [Acidobacteria bacterium]|nr:hypothetical protein [Acidobacteriota bacterium]